MSAKLELLSRNLQAALAERIGTLTTAFGEVTLVVAAEHYKSVATTLRDHPELRFDQAIDLCGVDYSTFGNQDGRVAVAAPRYAAVSQLLSVEKNWRLRLRVFAPDNDFPMVDSLTDVWNSLNWFEREAFDLYGIMFNGHADLRRILTDYGFIGHPFRKDFPISGYVEMCYDPAQRRVVYQPVTIEPRTVTPRVIREDNYGGTG